MRTVNLSSGSKGNSTYIEANNTKILIDNGLAFSVLSKRLNEIGVDACDIDAILVTHEHIDHIGGIKAFVNKNKKAKIYIPAFVQKFDIPKIIELPVSKVEWYSTSTFFIKDLTISAFVLPHDSNFCVGYSIVFDNKKISIATDLGFVSKETLENLSNSDILFFESNHDEKLLINNPKYPARTKKRILSNKGHLSNIDCGKALVSLVKTGVKQVVLSHLSEENNTPMLAYTTIKKVLESNGIIEGDNVYVDVAYQEKIGTIFNL